MPSQQHRIRTEPDTRPSSIRGRGYLSPVGQHSVSVPGQLRIPGPTSVPARVSRAAAQPMINPRGPEFAILLNDCVTGVQSVLQTRNEILLFGASGTGGLEGAVANLCSPGERVLFCTNGWFGELWQKMAAAFHADAVGVSAPWGEAVDPDQVKRALDRDPAITKVFLTHNETSTGVLNDVAAIARVVKAAGRLLVLDSVSGVPCHPLPVDDLEIDVVVTASQKGWLAPPGLTMLAVSSAAMQAAERSRSPKWYFDFLRQRAAINRGFMHTTPPISIIYALREGLAMIQEEGPVKVWRRHERVARRSRLGLKAAGLELLAGEGYASNVVTAVRSPFSSSPELTGFLDDLARNHGLVLAQGLGALEGTTFRVGHLGRILEQDVDLMLDSLQAGLARHRGTHGAHALATAASRKGASSW